jgi:uncharacterized protein YbbC (DUF1343 family)
MVEARAGRLRCLADRAGDRGRAAEAGTTIWQKVFPAANTAGSNNGTLNNYGSAAASGVSVGAIFGPQHGFRSDVQDNMIETRHAHDEGRRVPVYSLYSDIREPTLPMLRDLDVLVIDLQDVGVRIYTYIYTMANCLKAARRHDIPVIVCDRPNPIGGDAVEGPMLVRGFESFVGMYPIPMRHGMTIGELAGMFNAENHLGANLHVIKMKGWNRADCFHCCL